jgi:hypothetical protein
MLADGHAGGDGYGYTYAILLAYHKETDKKRARVFLSVRITMVCVGIMRSMCRLCVSCLYSLICAANNISGLGVSPGAAQGIKYPGSAKQGEDSLVLFNPVPFFLFFFF